MVNLTWILLMLNQVDEYEQDEQIQPPWTKDFS